MASVATSQFPCNSAKAAIDHAEMNERGCAPRHFYLQKQAVGQIQPDLWKYRTVVGKSVLSQGLILWLPL